MGRKSGYAAGSISDRPYPFDMLKECLPFVAQLGGVEHNDVKVLHFAAAM